MEESFSFLMQNLSLILLIALASNYFILHFRNRNRELFELIGNEVLINRTNKLQFTLASKKTIPIESVVKIEVHGNRLSLFQNTSNATDVWVQPKYLKSEIEKAKNVFSHAVFLNCGS